MWLLPSHPLPHAGDLYLHHNALGGTLPTEWGRAGAFPNLRWLSAFENKLTGGEPLRTSGGPFWGWPCNGA